MTPSKNGLKLHNKFVFDSKVEYKNYLSSKSANSRKHFHICINNFSKENIEKVWKQAIDSKEITNKEIWYVNI